MSGVSQLPFVVIIASLVAGLVLLVVGARMREGRELEWGFLFGFAKNATVPGKLVYVLGGVIFVSAFIGLLNRPGCLGRSRKKPGCDRRYPAASISSWDDTGIVRVKVNGKTTPCYFRPTWDDPDAVSWARRRWPAGTKICARSLGSKARREYQPYDDEVVYVCTLKQRDGRYLSSFKPPPEADDDQGEDEE